MISYRRTFVLSLVVMMLFMGSFSAFSQNVPETGKKNQEKYLPDPGAMAVDLVIARPAGLVAMVGGTAFFIVSFPFSVLGGNSGDAWDSLVVSPAAYTFKRPLGEFGK